MRNILVPRRFRLGHSWTLPRLAKSRPLGERSEPFLAAKRPTASDEVDEGLFWKSRLYHELWRQRDTRWERVLSPALSQTLRGQRIKRERLGTRLPNIKDRANWSRDTFQPMRRRACVYQNTNQNIAPVIKNFHNSGRSRTESVIVSRLSGIFLRLFMRHTQFFQVDSVLEAILSREIFSTFCGLFLLLNNVMYRRDFGRFSGIYYFSIHRFFTKF